MANQFAKFEVSSLSRCRYILGGLKKFKMGHVTFPRPFQGQFVIRRLGLALINPHPKFEISMFTDYEETKGNTKCRNWGGLGVRCDQRLPAMSAFDRVHTTSYSTIIETMHLSCTVFELSKFADFNLPACI